MLLKVSFLSYICPSIIFEWLIILCCKLKSWFKGTNDHKQNRIDYRSEYDLTLYDSLHPKVQVLSTAGSLWQEMNVSKKPQSMNCWMFQKSPLEYGFVLVATATHRKSHTEYQHLLFTVYDHTQQNTNLVATKFTHVKANSCFNVCRWHNFLICF